MPEYIVATPFTMDGERLLRGRVLRQSIEQKRNFRILLNGGYISPLYDKKTKESFVQGCYLVVKSFRKGDMRLHPGHFIDLRSSSSFKNEQTLLSAGFIRRATEDDVARHSAHSPLSGTPGYAEFPGAAGRERTKMWNNPLWVKDQYVNNGRSIPDMCKEAGCSTSTMWKAIKALSIETRPRGRPTSK